MKSILISSYSGKGDIKQENQDSILFRTGTFGKRMTGLFIVADGCGGLADGDKISSLITVNFDRIWNEKLPKLIEEKKVSDKEIDKLLDETLEEINRIAIDYGKSVGKKNGSTLSLLLSIDKKYYIKNIGDSRIYHVKRRIRQLTMDQTVVADMIRNKEITEEAAKKHPKRHMLSMCVGYFSKLRIFSAKGKIRRGDKFILCSDGLYNCVEEKQMRKMIKRHKDFDTLATDMRKSIQLGKARDNVSVIVVKYRFGWFG